MIKENPGDGKLRIACYKDFYALAEKNTTTILLVFQIAP